MKKKIRELKADEMNGFNDIKRYHMQMQHMTDKQKAYWKRKPYDLGEKHEEDSKGDN
jgi:hypothetical protein